MATKSRARSRSPIMKDGDWICSGCKGHNYSRRIDCFQCKLTKASSEKNSNRGKVGAEDWDCLNCGGTNFSRRTECYKCHDPKVQRGQNQGGPGLRSNLKIQNDWWCNDCSVNNFPKNTVCFRCKKPKDVCLDQRPPTRGMMGNSGGGNNMRPFHQEDTSDWICNSCGVHNGCKRDHCYKCERSRRNSKPNRNQGPGNSTNFDLRQNINEPNREQKTAYPMKPGDWNCGQCGGHNFARRNACFKCKTPKEEGNDNFAVTFDCDRQDDRPGPSNLNTMMLNHSLNNRLGPKSKVPLMETPGAVRRRPRVNSGSGNFAAPVKRQRRMSFDDGHQNQRGMSPPRQPIRTAFYEQPRQNMPRGRDFPADWTCGNCDIENFAKRNTCLKCNNDRRNCELILGNNMGSIMGQDDRRPGPMVMNEAKSDYICQECGTHNHFNNTNCKKCNRPNPRVGRSGSGRGVSDWQCRDCNCSNFARRSSCFKCGQSRIQCELREVHIMNVQEAESRMQGGKVERVGDGWFCDECDNCNDPVNFKCRRCGSYRAGDDVNMRGGKGSSQPPQLQVWQQRSSSPTRSQFSPIHSQFSPTRNNFHNDHSHNRGRSLNNHATNNRYIPRSPPPPRRGGPRPGLVEPNLHQDKRFNPDWTCKNCNINNFVKRKECFRCTKPKAECEEKKDKHGVPIGPNDWLCDGCGENNFSRRTQCFKCGVPRIKLEECEELLAPEITIEG